MSLPKEAFEKKTPPNKPRRQPNRLERAMEKGIESRIDKLPPRVIEAMKSYFIACEKFSQRKFLGPKGAKRRYLYAYASAVPFGFLAALLALVLPEWLVLVIAGLSMFFLIGPIMTIIEGPFLPPGEDPRQHLRQ